MRSKIIILQEEKNPLDMTLKKSMNPARCLISVKKIMSTSKFCVEVVNLFSFRNRKNVFHVKAFFFD